MKDFLTVLTALWTEAWAETPELLSLSVLFWAAVLVGAVLRWGLRRTRASSVVFGSLPVIGVVGVVLAGIDLANGGEPQFVHTSMAAYLAAPLGVGARVIARVDAIVTERRWKRDAAPATELRDLARRVATYVGAGGVDIALSHVHGDAYRFFTQPELVITPAGALEVNWLHLMAFTLTLAVVIDVVMTAGRVWKQRGSSYTTAVGSC